MEFSVRGRDHGIAPLEAVGWELAIIEQMFYRWAMKQDPQSRRLTGMHAPLRQIVGPILRMGAMVGLAMLLIMGLFPAVLEAQAGRN